MLHFVLTAIWITIVMVVADNHLSGLTIEWVLYDQVEEIILLPVEFFL